MTPFVELDDEHVADDCWLTHAVSLSFSNTSLLIHSFPRTLGPPDHARNQDALASLLPRTLGIDLALSEPDVLNVLEPMLGELAHGIPRCCLEPHGLGHLGGVCLDMLDLSAQQTLFAVGWLSCSEDDVETFADLRLGEALELDPVDLCQILEQKTLSGNVSPWLTCYTHACFHSQELVSIRQTR